MAVGEGGSTVERLISTSGALGNTTIDLSRKKLEDVPPELFDLQHLEFLYLEGNYISSLPDGFFEKLSNLRWLDLRNNCLTELPSTIGQHKNLRTVLLEGNKLKSLPFELGLCKSLSGLNLTGNPLETPPLAIIERGTQEVLRYLREQLTAQDNEAEKTESSSDESEEGRINNSEEKAENASNSTFQYNPRFYTRSAYNRSRSDLVGPSHTPISFQTPPNRPDLIRWQYDEYLRATRNLQTRSGSRKFTTDAQRASSAASHGQLLNKRVRQVPGRSLSDGSVLTTPDSRLERYVAKMQEEQRTATIAALNEQEALVIRKRKEKQALDDWREKTRQMKLKKHQSSRHNSAKVRLKVPYGTSDDKEEVSDKMKKRQLEHAARIKELLEARSIQDKKSIVDHLDIERKIKKHLEKINDDREKHKDPKDRVEEAKKNLEIAHQLQKDLDEKRELEYRLRAFTGDNVKSIDDPRLRKVYATKQQNQPKYTGR